MKPALFVTFLIGLTATAYALDLSHAKRSENEIDPRIFSALTDFYNQVIHPPLNHIVTNMALLGAQVLAGVSATGLPLAGSRSLLEVKQTARVLAEKLWNQGVKPHIERALSRFSQLAATMIVNLSTVSSLHKRDMSEAEMRNFFDDLWNNAVRPPVEDALSGLSLMLAQVLAGIGINGVNLGKRDLSEAEMRNFFDDLWNNAVRPPVEDALSGLSLMLAQVLAGIGINGVNLGKRDMSEAEMRNFFDDLWNNAVRPPVEDALSGLSLMLAQVLAGIGINGVNLGKRDLALVASQEEQLRGFFDTLGQTLLGGLQSVWTNVVQDPLEQALQTSALLAAQVLAGIGVNGVNLG